MNLRAALHTLAIICTAIATGTAVIAGIGPALNTEIVSVAGIVAMAVNTYLGLTTSGAAKPPAP